MSNKIRTASPTIWNTAPYKVTVYTDDAERNHKECLISVNVHNGDETDSISIQNGELLAGNFSQRSVNWCFNELLTEENKLRINIMIDSRDFYRLDREFEIKGHPLPKDIITAVKNPTWDDKLILEVTYINNYEYMIQFKDKNFKIVDILPYISKYPEIYTPLMKDKTLLKKFQYDLIEMYWDDIMGIEAQTLYDMGKNIERKEINICI